MPMTPLAELLDRLRRRRRPPGRAAAMVGVPAAEPDIAAELAPLFGHLDEIDAEVAAIVQAAQSEAAAIEREGQRQAQRIVERAAGDAQLAADRLRQERRHAAERNARAILAEARAEAGDLRERAAQRSPAVVEDILGLLARSPN
jgi:vacuolar-type H+-ATPase subunit H